MSNPLKLVEEEEEEGRGGAGEGNDGEGVGTWVKKELFAMRTLPKCDLA